MSAGPARQFDARDAVRDAHARALLRRGGDAAPHSRQRNPAPQNNSDPPAAARPQRRGEFACRNLRSSWRVCSYNAMSVVRVGRWAQLSSEFQNLDVVALQGLCVKADSDVPCAYFRTSHHHVFQWGYTKGRYTNKSCGVAILLRHKRLRLQWVREVYSPPDQLAGRAGALRIKGRCSDLLVIVGYVPVEPTNASQRQAVHAFYTWVDSLLSRSPARTLPILLLDANGRMGLQRLGDGPGQIAPDHDATVGPWGAEAQNHNGTQLRNLLYTHHLAAANTHFSRGCGATYHGPLGHPSRIDYVVVPQGLLQHITDVRVWYRSGYRLQLIDSPDLRDHCPIVVDFNYELSFPQPQHSAKWDFTKLGRAVDGHSSKEDFLREVQTSLAALPQPSDDVCASWNALNTIVCRLARRFFTQSGSRRTQRPLDTQQAAEQTMLAREDYRDACLQLRRQQQPAQSVHLAWAAWQKYLHFKSLQRHSKQLCRRDRRHKVDDLVQQLQQAARDKNLSLQWKLAYQIAGGKHGPKKRRYDHPQRYRATAQEWVDELSLAGPQGGCAATRLDKASADAIFPFVFARGKLLPKDAVSQAALPETDMLQYDGTDGRLRRAQPARVGVHARHSALEDLGKLREAVRTLQRQRAVPDWCAPAEVWRMLLFPSEHCDRGASLSSQFHGQVEARLLHTLVQTRASQRVPTLWNISCPVELDKRNNKPGCSGKRLIHLLCPVGKAYFHQLWARTVSRYAHHACGFVRHRRREQAITQQRCINWRLQHAGLGHVTVLYDVKNAFPSPSHASLDAAVRQHARPDDVELLMQRHREAFILLRDPFQPTYTILQVGCGNMQGDRMAPSQFLSVYLPAVEEWHVACKALPHGAALLATDPVSGQRCDTSLSTFADDVAKTHAIPTAPEFAPIVTRMDADLDRSLQGLGMVQNHDKKELLVRLMGSGAQKAMQDIYHARTAVRGQFKRVAKYLGGWMHHSCATSPEISQRIAAAKRSWSVLQGFWFRRDAPRAQRQLVFKAMVLSAVYSGLDAVPSHKGDDKRITQLLVSLSRKLLQGRACTKPWHDVRGHHRSWTNLQVFQEVGLFASATERCVRRLLWWQNIVKRPDENVALLASLFGQFPWESYAQLGPDGRLTQHANPWIRQLVEDLHELCRFDLPAPGLVHDRPLLLFSAPHQAVFLIIADPETLQAGSRRAAGARG